MAASEGDVLVKVGYPKPVGYLMLVLGVLSLGLGLVLASMTGRVNIGSIIPGIICIVMGPAYLTKPYFWVERGAVIIPALIGPVKKTKPFKRLADLSIVDGKLMLDGKKVLGKFMARKEDWAALEQALLAAQAEETFE